MSPRRHQRRDAPPPLATAGLGSVEDYDGVDYAVRPVSAARATKTYRCPGCDQEIPPAVPHVLVWPADRDAEIHRRHWHRSCWEARHRRRPVHGA